MNITREHLEQLSMSDLITIVEIVEAMLNNQKAAPDFPGLAEQSHIECAQ